MLAGCPNTSKALEELCERRIRELNVKIGGVSGDTQIICITSGTSGKVPSATASTGSSTKSSKNVSKPTHHLGMTTEFIENNEPTTILISGEPDRTGRPAEGTVEEMGADHISHFG